MREKKFLRKLNKKENKDSSSTYALVMELINSSDNKPVPNNIFNRLISKVRRGKSYEKIISENFKHIFSKTHSSYKSSLLDLLMNDKRLENIIQDNFLYIIKALNQEETYVIKSFLRRYTEDDKGKEFLTKNVNDILSNINIDHLFNAVQSIKGISQSMDNILNEALESSKHDIVLSILNESTKYRQVEIIDNKSEILGRYVDTLEIMINELLESEGKRMIDINEIRGGSYSSIFEIGSKVLKVGGVRETYDIPNHRRILQPLTRINFMEEETERTVACVEIANNIERNHNQETEDEELLYSIWRELREDGIVWTDIKSANIGKLRTSNIPTLNNEKMYVNPESIGFDEEPKGTVLEAGEWVIIDTDFIYLQGDLDMKTSSLSRFFKKRYQQEQQAKVAKKHGNTSNLPQKITEQKEK